MECGMDMKERYKSLAVLLEEMAPVSIVRTLWRVTAAEARRSSEYFVDHCFAQRDSVNESIRPHDLQLDYLRALYPKEDKEALALIHGARLLSNVVAKDPQPFASQMIGRLLRLREAPAIQHFMDGIAAGTLRPWLRPLHPAPAPQVGHCCAHWKATLIGSVAWR